jgi:hypothetical protein
LSLTASTGSISGTPTAAGNSSFTVQVKDSKNNTGTKALSISVAAAAPQPLKITTTSLGQASSGIVYSTTMKATGGTPGYTWSITNGQLPAGLALMASSGTITGSATTVGQSSFTVQVKDSATTPATATQALNITVVQGTALDQYGGITAMPSANPSTGIFRTEKFGNKWMFVDPANNGFFMIGMYVLAPDNSIDDMGGDYSDRVTAKYGDPGPTWGTAQLQRIQSWGYNANGPYASAYVLPTTTDSRWKTPDETDPVKVPFIFLIRPAYYGMLNQSNWSPQPIKNMMYSSSSFYTGFRPGNGIADYYDSNLNTFFTNELASDAATGPIKSSPYKQYLIGVNVDDSDEMYGFGNGPDFVTGHSNTHLGWLVLTMSPVQTANPNKGFIYPDTTIHSKQALHDQLEAEYGTIGALNAAWSSNYTTFDSSGATITGASIATGSGTTLSFGTTLTGTVVAPFSLQIFVAGQMVGGDTGNGAIWGPNLSGGINYATGALNLSFSSGHAPVSGAAVTASYIQNGWGVGTGLMDEDGRPSHQGWIGTDYTFMTDVNANLKSDLDNFLYQIAAHYFSMSKAGVESWMPGALYLGPDTLGSWGAPSNRNVLKAAGQYIDVMAMGLSQTGPLTQPMLDFIFTYYGDKPFYTGEFRVANPDSAFFRYTALAQFPTQAARGQDYFNNVTTYPGAAYTATGSRPYVGVLWWQYLDNWGEKNDWGLVSLSDNAYDGKESVTGPGGVSVRSVPCTPPLQNYLCGGEERNYGDVITSVTSAHQQMMQAVQH